MICSKRRFTIKKTLLVLLTSLLVFAYLSPARAASGLSDPGELGSFLDGIMNAHLKDHNIPGATLSVVKDGKIFFKKGYGYADLDQRIPVDPDRTIFCVGSISKLFTWTSTMQMVEKGKLDLNADINTYLRSFKIPATYPAPVTLTNLMTHTAGFEDTVLGLVEEKADDLVSLEDSLKKHIPARVFPPGKLSSYSNYGTALAGHLVELASGSPFDEYAEKNIFKPLGMKHTTFKQKYSPETVKKMSKGYAWGNGRYRVEATQIMTLYPAGTVTSTAPDMAAFMIAHLQNGRYGQARILNPETARKMRQPIFGPDPRLNKMCYGIYEMNMNGERIIGHGGDLSGFHSLLALLPEHNLGLFVSYNSSGGRVARDKLLQAFMDRYFPTPLPLAPKPVKDITTLKSKIEGDYLINRRPYTTFEKIQYLNMSKAYLPIRVQKDGLVLIGDKCWAEKAPLFFVELYGKELSSIRRQDDGSQRYFIHYPFISFERLAWHETPDFQDKVYKLCLLLFLSALIGWPVMGLINLRKNAGNPGPAVLARWLAWTICLLFVLGYWAVYLKLGEGLYQPSVLVPYLSALLAGAFLTLGAVIFCVLAWKDRYWSLWGRFYYSLVTLALLAFIWWLNFWNLLGFKF